MFPARAGAGCRHRAEPPARRSAAGSGLGPRAGTVLPIVTRWVYPDDRQTHQIDVAKIQRLPASSPDRAQRSPGPGVTGLRMRQAASFNPAGASNRFLRPERSSAWFQVSLRSIRAITNFKVDPS
jgi:hypothetical protein